LKSRPGQVLAEAPRKLGDFFRDIFRMNLTNFRMFCPDESNSNRLNSIFEATKRCSMAEIVSIDDQLGPDGRVMEVLSEHLCQGWLEGYLLTGRHGMWSSYEAFAQVVDSMTTQHANGLSNAATFPGAGRWHLSTFCSQVMHGATITMATATRQPGTSSMHWSAGVK